MVCALFVACKSRMVCWSFGFVFLIGFVGNVVVC